MNSLAQSTTSIKKKNNPRKLKETIPIEAKIMRDELQANEMGLVYKLALK